jgi:hypothetical protein
MLDMNLKEFDYKQFLLEKGERVGLGIAVTLMVLMLIFSLFMPSRGFFSGSPSEKAKVLEDSSKALQTKLNTLQPGPDDLPPKDPKEHLIALDIDALESEPYEMLVWYDPLQQGNLARRPPIIKNLVESRVVSLHVPVDTYIFNKDFSKIMVLLDKDKGGSAPVAGGGQGAGAGNRLAGMYQQSMQNMRNSPMQGMRGFPGMGGSGRVAGGDDRPEYEAREVELTKADQYKPARQLRPTRMAIIVGSFPYKEQLEEFRTKLHLASIQDVFNDTVEEEKDTPPKAAFRFLGVKVERKEVDANGKDLRDSKWMKLELDVPYKLWLLSTGYPYQDDSHKLDPIKPLFPGLVMPRLREFHEETRENSMAAMFGGSGAMGGGSGAFGSGSRQPALAGAKEAEPEDSTKAKYYPEIEDKLPKIQETLEKLADVNPKTIAVPPEKFRTGGNFDPFNSYGPSAATEDTTKQQKDKKDTSAQGGATVPEYCLARIVDVTVEPGKFYKYRLKVRMANPNYKNPNVASPAYKEKLELESADWYEVRQTVSVPPETIYYVVDQKQLNPNEMKDLKQQAKETPQYDMWQLPNPRENQVFFQFHRWVESAPIVPGERPDVIGDWAVADRVLVSRGEYVGQTVKIDLPVWQYVKDSFILPYEDQKKKRGGKIRTGVQVNFGYDNSDAQTILVDFEGGRVSHAPPAAAEGARPARGISETTPIEVLMLSPDGKLLARNSQADANDKERQERREEFQKRVQHVREGKPGGAGGGGTGLDSRTGGTRR